MATVYWTGGANDGNWQTGANWNTGSAPASTNDVVIGETDQDIDAGLTGNAYALNSITVTPGFGGKIGSASTPLTVQDITVRIRYAGRGQYAKFALSGGTATCAEVSMEHAGNGVVYLGAGTWTLVNNGLGAFVCEAGAVVTTLNNAGGTGEVRYNATVITTLSNAGRLTIYRSVTTNNILNGGTTIQENNGTTTYTLSTTANIHGGGVYNKRSGGTDVTVNLFPRGKFTTAGASGGSGAFAAVTITTLNFWSGGIFEKDRTPGLAVTVTTTTRVGASLADVA